MLLDASSIALTLPLEGNRLEVMARAQQALADLFALLAPPTPERQESTPADNPQWQAYVEWLRSTGRAQETRSNTRAQGVEADGEGACLPSAEGKTSPSLRIVLRVEIERR